MVLYQGQLENFWFDSGTPSFLVDLIKKEYEKNNYSIFRMEEFKVGKMEPKCFDVNATPLPALLLQTGYLTIHNSLGATYTLRFPNLEVQSSFQKYI